MLRDGFIIAIAVAVFRLIAASASKSQPIRRARAGGTESVSAARLCQMSYAPAVYKQQAASCERIPGSGGACQEV